MSIRQRLHGRSRGQRFAVQLSSDVFARLEASAAAEGLAVAAVARRAIMIYLLEVAEAVGGGPRLTPVDVDHYEENLRRGRRGPTAQWPERVFYVLPTALANELREAAAESGRSVPDLAREAIIRHVALVLPDAPAKKQRLRDRHGFTHSEPTGGKQAEPAPRAKRARKKTRDRATS